MNSRKPWILLTVLALVWFAEPVSADEPLSGRQIMELVDDRDDGNRAIWDMEMVLIDKRDNRRIRKIRYHRIDQGEDLEDTHFMMFFDAPADVKDTGFLTYDYDDDEKDDDQWLYLPALKKTKRIASNDKSGSFMGSDFSYSDMTSRELDNYDYRLLKEDVLNGHEVWIVEAIPNNEKEIRETGYTKTIAFVRKDNYVIVRAKNWLKKAGRNKYLDVKKLELIDGIWVETEMHMTTKKGKETLHKTILSSHNVKFNQDLDPTDFKVRTLEKGL